MGCGTGRFSFSVADKCISILGIDLSTRNIERATRWLSGRPNSKISFQHTNVSNILRSGKEHFDYAEISYFVHEVEDCERVNLLKDIAQIAIKAIVGNYLFPKQMTLAAF